MAAEHLIRLRAAWEGTFFDGDSGAGRTTRIDLPVRWEAIPTTTFLLRRRFQGPPGGPSSLVLHLRVENAPGIRSVTVNTVACQPLELGPASREYPIDSWNRSRNEVVLEVDPSAWPRDILSSEAGWGMIALVVRTRGAAGHDGSLDDHCL